MSKRKKNKPADNISYQNIIQQIDNDSLNQNNYFSLQDDKPLVDAHNRSSRFLSQYSNRDEQYSDLLKKYISIYDQKTRANKIYKGIFFGVVIFVLLLLVVVPVVLSFLILNKEETSVADIGLIIGSTTSIISSILVLPKIIAEHLFPVNEDTNMIDMVKNMQSNDAEIRTLLSKGDDNNTFDDNLNDA